MVIMSISIPLYTNVYVYTPNTINNNDIKRLNHN